MRPLAAVLLALLSGCALFDFSLQKARDDVLAHGRACDEGDSAACLEALRRSNSVVASSAYDADRRPQYEAEDRWLDQLRTLAAPGCEAGFATACAHLSDATEKIARDRGDPKRRELQRESLRWARTACDVGHPGMCTQAAFWLRERGTLGERFAFLRRACDLGTHAACGELATAYEKGEGVAADPRRAGAMRIALCRVRPMQFTGFCGPLSYGEQRDAARAKLVAAANGFETDWRGYAEGERRATPPRGLDTPDPAVVARFSKPDYWSALFPLPKPTTPLSAASREHFESALREDAARCERDPSECTGYGANARILGIPPEEWAPVLEDGCRRGGLPACTVVASLYDVGAGVPYDPVKARALRQQTCGTKEPETCALLQPGHFDRPHWAPLPDGSQLLARIDAYLEAGDLDAAQLVLTQLTANWQWAPWWREATSRVDPFVARDWEREVTPHEKAGRWWPAYLAALRIAAPFPTGSTAHERLEAFARRATADLEALTPDSGSAGAALARRFAAVLRGEPQRPVPGAIHGYALPTPDVDAGCAWAKPAFDALRPDVASADEIGRAWKLACEEKKTFSEYDKAYEYVVQVPRTVREKQDVPSTRTETVTKSCQQFSGCATRVNGACFSGYVPGTCTETRTITEPKWVTRTVYDEVKRKGTRHLAQTIWTARAGGTISVGGAARPVEGSTINSFAIVHDHEGKRREGEPDGERVAREAVIERLRAGIGHVVRVENANRRTAAERAALDLLARRKTQATAAVLEAVALGSTAPALLEHLEKRFGLDAEGFRILKTGSSP